MYITGSPVIPRNSELITAPPGLHPELWQLIISYVVADKRFAQVVSYASVSRFFLDACLKCCLQVPLAFFLKGSYSYQVVRTEEKPFALDKVVYQGQELLAVSPDGKHYYRSRFWTHKNKLYIFSAFPKFEIKNLNLSSEIKKYIPGIVPLSGVLDLNQATAIIACQPCEKGFFLVTIGGLTLWEFENDEPIFKKHFSPSALGLNPFMFIEAAWCYEGKLTIKQTDCEGDRRGGNSEYSQLDVQEKLGIQIVEHPYSFLRYPEKNEFSHSSNDLLIYYAGQSSLCLKDKLERLPAHPFIFLAEGFLFIFYGGPSFKVIELATWVDYSGELAPLLTHVLKTPESAINSLYLHNKNGTYFLELIMQKNKSGKESVLNTMGELDLFKISLELSPTKN